MDGTIPKVSGSGCIKKRAKHEPESKVESSFHPWFLLSGSCLEFQP